MSLAVLKSRALSGMEAPEVTVEVHLANGLPGLTIVGLPETEVKEARDRVRAALQNANFELPSRRITVNLAPADLPKESGRFDLPIALGILAASRQIPVDQLNQYQFAGELSLSGELRPIRGALAMTYAMWVAGQSGNKPTAFILPRASADEAALVTQAQIYPADSLLQVAAHFAAQSDCARLQRHTVVPQAAQWAYPDFSDVKGQLQARRALEVAASGMHSVIMVGPPGTGKSMLANRLPGILAAMTEEQALETAAVQSLVGEFHLANWRRRPFRSPHYTASAVALVGGGHGHPRPGEISLVHNGSLFLDEIPEFDRRVLESMRVPLESGRITISRAARQADFPARFQLIAAMNPCPCGYLGHPSGKCHCTPEAVKRYQGKISGPMLDRIDLQIQVPALSHDELIQHGEGEPSAAIRSRVERAHDAQLTRQGKSNNDLGPADIDRYCSPDQAGQQLLQSAMQKMNWSARAYHRVLKVARSVADLELANQIGSAHVAEAISYRRVLREQ